MDMERPRSGWTFWRVLGLILGLVGMANFGFWSLCGAWAVIALRPGAIIIAFVVVASVLTYLCYLLMRAMIRGAEKQTGKRPEHDA